MRILRLVLSVIIVTQGLRSGDWRLMLLGALFSLMPLLNMGCCAGGSCAAPPEKNNKGQSDSVSYEEVK